MSTSRALRVLGVLATLLVAAAAEGCGRSAAEPATREAAGPAPQAAPAAGQTAASDPSEQITPEELATIPEPVSPSPEGPGASNPKAPAGSSQKAREGDSGRTGGGPSSQGFLWRVQVFATQDRDLAQRTAREAAQLFHAEARVDYEASRYKVRLGGFASEEEAGTLRDTALRSGFPGAFRIRCTPDTTINKN